MQRSEINHSIDRAQAFFTKMKFRLPHWAYWSPEQWRDADSAYDEVRNARLGWDVTDFGSGDLANIGRTIFTLRNGKHNDPIYCKSYAEKAMCLFPGQKSVIHCHKRKREDIICRGGGPVLIEFWRSTPENTLSDAPLAVSVDGCATTVKPGQALHLEAGMSVCVPPLIYHRFWTEGDEPTLSMEVSSVCDDLTDNLFVADGERFPAISEDEPRRWVLCSEYDKLWESSKAAAKSPWGVCGDLSQNKR